MTYLQLDLSSKHSIDTKRLLARLLGSIIARITNDGPRHVWVAFRELGSSGLWRCTDGEPYEAALLVCDIRLGTSSELRQRLAEELVEVCMAVLQLESHEIDLEFTQHADDEMTSCNSMQCQCDEH